VTKSTKWNQLYGTQSTKEGHLRPYVDFLDHDIGDPIHFSQYDSNLIHPIKSNMPLPLLGSAAAGHRTIRILLSPELARRGCRKYEEKAEMGWLQLHFHVRLLKEMNKVKTDDKWKSEGGGAEKGEKSKQQ
jgi:hypothetical protein